jgi:hypothetical protein
MFPREPRDPRPGMGSPLCHIHCGELHEIMRTVPVSEPFTAIAAELGNDDH